MQEKIETIAQSIKERRKSEYELSLKNAAIGRSFALYNNKNEIFWLTNNENTPLKEIRDDRGNVTQRITQRTTLTSGEGKAIYKNTKIGEILIINHEGKHLVNAPGGQYTIEIFNRASYVPTSQIKDYAVDIIIKLAGEKKIHSFQDITKILSLQIEIEKEQATLNKSEDEEASEQLIKRIKDKQIELKAYLDRAQSFIRKYAELRYQPILDPIQESIKRSKIFNGTLIINGGPGTGKTTSLIQRIKFLISNSINEYITLNQRQKDIINDEKNCWIFYSPNELLALFLRNSMTQEQLNADTETVKIWSSHKNELVKAYKLVDTATKRPFLIYNKSKEKRLFANKPKNIKKIIAEFNEFYLAFQNDKLNKVIEIDVTPFKWKKTGVLIQNYLRKNRDITNISELIRLFINLHETYKDDSDKIVSEYSLLIKQVASRIQIIITKDLKRTTSLSEILNQWKNNYNDVDEEEDDDISEIELEDFEEKEEQSDFESELFSKLKSLCRKQSLKKFDKNTKFSKRDKELLMLIPEVEYQIEYEQIGQTAFFKKNFERVIKGIISNVFREVPLIYKKHRRNQLSTKNKNWDLQILDELVKKDKNSRIHPDEQAILLYFINNICINLFKGFLLQYNNLNHPYLNAFKNHCKPVIGIDEATDFSIIDLLSINSFRHPQLSSVTLSGDIMQRITSVGINSWEDFSILVPETEVKDLEISYRQSPTLLSLAQSIYERSTGKQANYKSYIQKDEAEPKPLIFISDDDNEKLSWIAERIIEIYKAYGDSIPSIAIFLPNENLLDHFAQKLGDLDILSDVGILVKACRNGEVLGDKNTVRIFSIDKIKGLEFEAVFFHDLDDIQNLNLSSDMLLKYLYVGLSRATFYLGLTVTNELNSNLNFILDNFDRSGKTWSN